jgi:hypothetical protein
MPSLPLRLQRFLNMELALLPKVNLVHKGLAIRHLEHFLKRRQVRAIVGSTPALARMRTTSGKDP